jgi:hypothetical protein
MVGPFQEILISCYVDKPVLIYPHYQYQLLYMLNKLHPPTFFRTEMLDDDSLAPQYRQVTAVPPPLTTLVICALPPGSAFMTASWSQSFRLDRALLP